MSPAKVKKDIVGKRNSLHSSLTKSGITTSLNFNKNELCKTVFNESVESIFLLDYEGNFVEYNKTLYLLLGYKKSELKKINFYSLIDIEYKKKLKKYFGDVLKNTTQKKPLQIKLHKKNGDYLFLETKFSQVKNQGQSNFVLCIGHDVSYHIKIEDALRESENKYHLIFENMMNGFAYLKVLFDKNKNAVDFSFLEVNKSFEEITLLKKENIINRKLSEISSRDNILKWIKLYNHAKKSGKPYKFERYFHQYNKWLNLSASIPHPNAVVLFFEDINERKKAEEAFKFEQYLLQNLMSNFPDTMYFKDCQSRFIRINEAQAKTLGLKDASEAIGKSDLDFFGKDFSKDSLEDEQQILTSGIPLIDKLEKIKLADGKHRWVSATKVPMFDGKGKVNGLVGISRDITERVNTEKELIETRQQLKNIFDNLDHIFWSKDITANKYLHVSYGCERILGYPPESFYENVNLFLNIIHKDDRQKAENIFKGNINTPETAQFRIINSDGQIRWVECNAKPSFNTQVKIIRIDGMIVDVTERKKAEEQILISEHKFRSLFDGAIDAIFLMDRAKLVDCNLKTYEIFNCSREQIIGKTPYQISPELQPDGSNSKTSSLKKIEDVLSGVPQSFEWEHKKFNGEKFSTEVSLNKVMIEGKPLIQAIVRDVTEKKKAQKIQNVLYRISEAVNSTENISTLYKKIHDSIKELMKAKNFYIALYDEDKDILTFPYWVDEIDPVPEPRKLKKGLTEYVMSTGRDMLIDEETDYKLRAQGDIEVIGEPSKIWMGVALKIDEKPIGVIAVQDYEDPKTYNFDDMRILNYVSEQIAFAINKKSAEEKLINYAKELKELNASKDKFFSIISHDLRSPFHALLGLTEIMADEFSSLTMEELKNFNQEIYKNLRNLYRLIDNLLEWSRIQTGKMEFRPVRIDLFEKTRDVINILMGNALKKGIKLENNINEACFLNADQDMLQSILQNIISNAIKFTNTGGVVSVCSEEKDTFCEIRISDSGVGIRPDELDLLFRIDTHYSTIGTAKEKGTGLGLVLCKELIEKHGGTIRVESEFEKGTDFIFTLPLWQN